LRHAIAVSSKNPICGVDVCVEDNHGCVSPETSHQPQQSVLNPQAGQRHTACIRYIAAPQRSHSVFSSVGGATFTGEIGRAGGRCGVWSDMASDYRIQTDFDLVRGRVSHHEGTLS